MFRKRWNSVYVRFRRWAEQGVWDALLDTLVGLWSAPFHILIHTRIDIASGNVYCSTHEQPSDHKGP